MLDNKLIILKGPLESKRKKEKKYVAFIWAGISRACVCVHEIRMRVTECEIQNKKRKRVISIERSNSLDIVPLCFLVPRTVFFLCFLFFFLSFFCPSRIFSSTFCSSLKIRLHCIRLFCSSFLNNGWYAHLIRVHGKHSNAVKVSKTRSVAQQHRQKLRIKTDYCRMRVINLKWTLHQRTINIEHITSTWWKQLLKMHFHYMRMCVCVCICICLLCIRYDRTVKEPDTLHILFIFLHNRLISLPDRI